MSPSTLHFSDANSRPTYFTIHNVREAHRHTRGKGVRVGVIDWLFALDSHKGLYADCADITGCRAALHEGDGHGLWMATVLREMAPECDIVAVNGVLFEEHLSPQDQDERRCRHLIESIDWAIGEGLDVLTYSCARVPREPAPCFEAVSAAISRAAASGIVTTFIHNDHPRNIWPFGCLQYKDDSLDHRGFTREPDLNICHNDYNTVMVERCERYSEMRSRGDEIRSGNDLPFFSFSSMSPVLGGFVALLKSMRPDLTPDGCRDVLVQTSYPIAERGEHWYDINPCPRVVDIGKAAGSLL